MSLSSPSSQSHELSHFHRRPRGQGGLVVSGVIFSLLIHGGMFAYLLWNRAPNLPEPEPEQTISMLYEDTGSPQNAPPVERPADAAAHLAATPLKASPVHDTPKLQPVTPPPSPPPPPPAQALPKASDTAVEAPLQQHATVKERGEVSEAAERKQAPAEQKAQVRAPARDVPKLPKKPMASRTEQPHEAKKMQANSQSLLATLDSFRSQQKQEEPPKVRPNSAQGGAPHVASHAEEDAVALTSWEQSAIGSSVQRCYQEDTLARNYRSFFARLSVTVDANGEARMVSFLPETKARMAADPAYRVQAERARAAVLSPVCAHLPVPKRLLGQVREFHFLFRP